MEAALVPFGYHLQRTECHPLALNPRVRNPTYCRVVRGLVCSSMVSIWVGIPRPDPDLFLRGPCVLSWQVLEIKEEGIVPPLTCYCDLLTLCARRGRYARGCDAAPCPPCTASLLQLHHRDLWKDACRCVKGPGLFHSNLCDAVVHTCCSHSAQGYGVSRRLACLLVCPVCMFHV